MKNTVILEYEFEKEVAMDILDTYGIDYMEKDNHIYVDDDGVKVLIDNNITFTVLERREGENEKENL